MAGGRSMEFTFLEEFGLYHAVMYLREAREMAKQNSLALCLFCIRPLPASLSYGLLVFYADLSISKALFKHGFPHRTV